MKKLKKLLFVTISIIGLIILLNINSYAVSQSSNTTNKQSTNTSNTATKNNSIGAEKTSNKNKNENIQETSTSSISKKSSNANLSNLGIKPNDFSGFKPTITTYNATVSENVEEVTIYATAQDSNATVSGTGKKILENGENTVSVVVTAEDGTSKTYTININKSENAKDNAKNNNQDESKGLSELKIEGLTLSPEFKSNVYEYKVKYIGEDTKLNINTVAADDNYIVEIVGNEGLNEGENIITILVSDLNGENIATYQVIVNKSLIDEEAVQKENAQKKNKIIIASAVGIVIVILIIILVIRHRKKYYEDEEEWEENHNDLFSNYNINEKYNAEQSNYEEELENNEIDFTEVKVKKEEEEKEALKRKFLENYNSNNYDEYEEYEKPKRKHKGKRFK